MRRSRLATLLAGVLMAAFLVPSAALATTAPSGAAAVAPSTVATPAIKLACSVVVPVPASNTPRIVCRWTAVTGPVAEYRVWRSVDGAAARLVVRLSPNALKYADFNIRPGHVYSYRIVARDAQGNRLGTSAAVSVRYARAPEALAFNCYYKVDAAAKGVFCHWAASTRPAAVKYVLYRSVNGATREAIYRTLLNGKRSHLDTGVASGQNIRYAVVALASDGRVVGVSRIDTVLVP
jgi:hypothetical protein